MPVKPVSDAVVEVANLIAEAAKLMGPTARRLRDGNTVWWGSIKDDLIAANDLIATAKDKLAMHLLVAKALDPLVSRYPEASDEDSPTIRLFDEDN